MSGAWARRRSPEDVTFVRQAALALLTARMTEGLRIGGRPWEFFQQTTEQAEMFLAEIDRRGWTAPKRRRSAAKPTLTLPLATLQGLLDDWAQDANDHDRHGPEKSAEPPDEATQRWWDEGYRCGILSAWADLGEVVSRLVESTGPDRDCLRCETDRHVCPGCGVPVSHGEHACAVCAAEEPDESNYDANDGTEGGG